MNHETSLRKAMAALLESDIRAPSGQEVNSTAGFEVHYHGASLFPLYRVRITPDQSHPEHFFDIACKIIRKQNMAVTEAEGLDLLRNGGAQSPFVYSIIHVERYSFLFMEWIDESAGEDRQKLKTMLRKLYSSEFDYFGFDHNNFIGTLEQKNNLHSSFEEFWIEDRLLPMLDTGEGQSLISPELKKQILEISSRLIQEWQLNQVAPRLIHGDLWSGNLLLSSDGPCLIDPSVSYSHPEQDLAMLHLFGSPLSYEDCDEILDSLGLPMDVSERIPFWQIYPLLVHVNIFGSTYVRSIERILHYYQS